MDKIDAHALRKILARNMRIRRAELDITQEEVALRTGLTQAYLSGIEREKRNVSLDNIQKIATALETTGSALLHIR
ncbi:helix-turn-helix domain-containing protein [Phyllobacterium zundukense]|uniref:HTH cro/C1-type domain-containing protein n=1 Tax=Phyllobacterium zundukense TaxID=1867719 RepID=A0A2N9VYN5_9HYPH|nr:helix-turn-helix transcriptional regulator [Phyllobacterium zundukense]ATU95189.1 hypothetical protein BLM14_25965 [Phyllobacterium zundukense]PIO44603.1 hypothetical protein B5P45_12115 [Phyllobacterium zundukense]